MKEASDDEPENMLSTEIKFKKNMKTSIKTIP